MRKLVIPPLIVGRGRDNLPSAPQHRGSRSAHSPWLVTGSGASLVYLGRVGPDVCGDPNLQSAFNQFHNNLHRAEPGSIGGPAAGLHDAQGAEIVSRGCTFVPPS